MKSQGYAIRICADGKVKVEKVPNVAFPEEVSDETIAAMLACHDIELFYIDAENLPIGERFLCVFDDFGDEKFYNFNELANDLCGFEKMSIYGDALLFPCVRGEREDEEVLLSMPRVVADTVEIVVKAYQYAKENGLPDMLSWVRHDES